MNRSPIVMTSSGPGSAGTAGSASSVVFGSSRCASGAMDALGSAVGDVADAHPVAPRRAASVAAASAARTGTVRRAVREPNVVDVMPSVRGRRASGLARMVPWR
ncbi:hypothetical protein [Microcella alkaliphila]|uniref:hypothetical protein n=1 Tax=Microcella alkaliphila TaxID=279828 RepID=UPI00102A6A23|nr:hypothetical protein [Microcella alkaliphila]